MSQPLLTIDVDLAPLIRAMDEIPNAILAHLKPVAQQTAERIVAEAKARVARRTGHTAAQIRVEDGSRPGYSEVGPGVVFSQEVGDDGALIIRADDPTTKLHVEQWLEFGTKFMTPRPFFFVSADLERGAYERDSRHAIQAAIDETGLGD
jgi:hypothetical protein